MTDMPQTPQTPQTVQSLTVGQVAELAGTTVRTLHHYDEVGLLIPSHRSTAGYRLYTTADATRLQHVVVYRRLGFALEEIALLLDDPDADVAAHLRRQRAAVLARLDELTGLVQALDRALEAEMSGISLTTHEQKELFGERFTEHQEEYAREAEERWGDTDAWAQSQARTSRYTAADWGEVKAESEAVNAAFVAAMAAGHPATSDAATDAAEQARLLIGRRFHDLSHELHRSLADMYVTDPRFTRTYEEAAPGLARYVHDAIHANADRHAGPSGDGWAG